MNNEFFQVLDHTYDIQLNEQQKQAVLHEEGPCLLLAVPGGGKTTTLLARTAYLILNKGIDPSRILSITFSRASANDMKERFEEVYGGSISQPVKFSTIHSFAYGIVTNYHKSIGASYTLIEGGKNPSISKQVVLRQLYQKQQNDYLSDAELESLINDISYVKNSLLKGDDLKAYKASISGFVDLYEGYEQLKSDNHFIDFDDMLVICYEVLKTHENWLNAYMKKYDYLQVDEAQDTSLLQHHIIKLLAGTKENVLYVADDDQSIYGFRAACPTYLLEIEKHYKNVVILRMEHNYRSTKSIVSICNEVIKENTKRYSKNMVTDNQEGVSIELVPTRTRFDQMEAILKANETAVGDSCILYRNNQSSVMVAKVLVDENIPFYLKDFKNRFFTHWVIKDVINFMTFAQNPSDVNLFSKLYYRLRGYYINKQMIQGMKTDVDITVFDNLKQHVNLNEYQWENLTKLENHFKGLSNKTPPVAIDFLLDVMGYRTYLMDRAGESDGGYLTYLDMVRILKSIVKDSKDLAEMQLSIMDLESAMRRAAKNSKKDVITLSTIHSSKGLEWDNVYLIDLLKGMFPAKEAVELNDKGQVEALEEERRLLYVGMTRAKNKLTLLGHRDSLSLFFDEVDLCINPEKRNQAKSTPIGNNTYKPTHFKNDYKEAPDEVLNVDDYEIGVHVVHRKFGEGEIISCSSELVVVDFGKAVKKFNLAFAVKKKIIKLK